MAAVQERLWWYRALHHLVLDALGGHRRGRECRILDAGCGAGGLLLFLKGRGFEHLRGFDLSPEAVGICRARGLPVEAGDLRRLGTLAGPGTVDVIVSNDTLYFFEPEEQASIVAGFGQALAPGGLLILNGPALSAFSGAHDRAVGIRRRFSKQDLARLLPASRFSGVKARYWPWVLSPAIFLVRSAQRRRLRRANPPEPRSDLWMPPRLLNGCLERIVRAENALLPWKPWGSSLFVSARKRPEAPMGSPLGQ